jgi:hypothetical protein
MIKLKHVVLASPEQMKFVIEGMRNPMNSWDKSDSNDCCIYKCRDDIHGCPVGGFATGEDDYSLMKRLAEAGTDHRKFMRMIPVYIRITAPLYWWKEFDTYKIATVGSSCSTMHKIHDKEFTMEDFSCEHLKTDRDFMMYAPTGYRYSAKDLLVLVIETLNNYRKTYLETKSKTDWWQMIQLLPSSYNQTRNIMMNYEVLANIYKSRKDHKLDEWRLFCRWIETLPYSDLITGGTNE